MFPRKKPRRELPKPFFTPEAPPKPRAPEVEGGGVGSAPGGLLAYTPKLEAFPWAETFLDESVSSMSLSRAAQ